MENLEHKDINQEPQCNENLTLELFRSCQNQRHPVDFCGELTDAIKRFDITLMIITRVDLNSVGFAVGSKTVEEDWKDWKRPVISRESAKLLRKST